MTTAEPNAIWRYGQPVRIVAGNGALNRLPDLVQADRVLLVCSKGCVRRGLARRAVALLGKSRVSVYDQVVPNPQLDDLDAAAHSLRVESINAIVAIGGGSALDTGKVLSALVPSNQSNCLERIFRHGQNQALDQRIPVVAIPTTSGTGAEMTPFATVWDRQTHRKHSLAGDALYPETAILDPALTLDLPRRVTLHTGLDAVSHAMESLWNKNRTPISEAFAVQAVKLIHSAFGNVLEQPDHMDSRAGMLWASALAGLAISQTRTAIAHAMSYPLTLRHEVPHGLACGFALPAIWEHCRHMDPGTLDTPEIRRTMELLKSLDIVGELRHYLDPADLFDLVLPEAAKADRAGNYIGGMDRATCEGIIAGALRC